jgi:hypothetical protein
MSYRAAIAEARNLDELAAIEADMTRQGVTSQWRSALDARFSSILHADEEREFVSRMMAVPDKAGKRRETVSRVTTSYNAHGCAGGRAWR